MTVENVHERWSFGTKEVCGDQLCVGMVYSWACPRVRDVCASDSELKHQILHHPCGYSSRSSSSSRWTSNDAARMTSAVTSETAFQLRVSAGLIHSCAEDIHYHMVRVQTCTFSFCCICTKLLAWLWWFYICLSYSDNSALQYRKLDARTHSPLT